MENDKNVQHYATIKKDVNVSDLISSPTEPTINKYYEYINHYKEREMQKIITYKPITTDTINPWKNVNDAYMEWKHALFIGKLNTFIPTTYHFDELAHSG